MDINIGRVVNISLHCYKAYGNTISSPCIILLPWRPIETPSEFSLQFSVKQTGFKLYYKEINCPVSDAGYCPIFSSFYQPTEKQYKYVMFSDS
jgi:hypothetical protein